MMPPTPMQNSYSSSEEEQGHFEVEDQIWSARARVVKARTKQFLEVSQKVKVEVGELESLLGPDDSDVNFRRILEEAEESRRTPPAMQQNSFSSTSERQWQTDLEEKRSGQLSGKVYRYKSGNQDLGGARRSRGLSELYPKEAAVFFRSSTQKRKRTILWQAEGVGCSTKKRGWLCKKAGNNGKKASPCPETTMKTPLPHQSSSSTRDDERQWISVEDGRKRRVALEEAAKRMLRYLEVSDDLKVGISELKEQLETPEEAGFSIMQIAQQARNEEGQKIFENF